MFDSLLIHRSVNKTFITINVFDFRIKKYMNMHNNFRYNPSALSLSSTKTQKKKFFFKSKKRKLYCKRKRNLVVHGFNSFTKYYNLP